MIFVFDIIKKIHKISDLFFFFSDRQTIESYKYATNNAKNPELYGCRCGHHKDKDDEKCKQVWYMTYGYFLEFEKAKNKINGKRLMELADYIILDEVIVFHIKRAECITLQK